MVSTKVLKKKNKPFRPQLYELIWVDPTGITGWNSKKEMENLQPARIISYCFIYSEDKGLTKTFASYTVDNEDGEEIVTYSDVNTIPSACILSKTEIAIKD